LGKKGIPSNLQVPAGKDAFDGSEKKEHRERERE